MYDFELSRKHVDFGDWEQRFKTETAKILNSDLTVNVRNLRNFRGLQIVLLIAPASLLKKFTIQASFIILLSIFLIISWEPSAGG